MTREEDGSWGNRVSHDRGGDEVSGTRSYAGLQAVKSYLDQERGEELQNMGQRTRASLLLVCHTADEK